MRLVKVSDRQPRLQIQFQDFLLKERVKSEAPQIYRSRHTQEYHHCGKQALARDEGFHIAAF